jgi:hypothetical protein
MRHLSGPHRIQRHGGRRLRSLHELRIERTHFESRRAFARSDDQPETLARRLSDGSSIGEGPTGGFAFTFAAGTTCASAVSEDSDDGKDSASPRSQPNRGQGVREYRSFIRRRAFPDDV